MVLLVGSNTLTATNAELLTRNDAALRQVGEWTGKYNALNSELSKLCMAEGCLSDLRDEKGDLLLSAATAEQKQAGADRVKPEDKARWPNQYAAFKAEREQVADGYPLEMWSGVDRAQVEDQQGKLNGRETGSSIRTKPIARVRSKTCLSNTS